MSRAPSAWLKTKFDDSVWAHLSGTSSTPFQAGLCGRVAVKVIDDRGNELMVELDLKDAEPAEVKPKPATKGAKA